MLNKNKLKKILKAIRQLYKILSLQKRLFWFVVVLIFLYAIYNGISFSFLGPFIGSLLNENIQEPVSKSLFIRWIYSFFKNIDPQNLKIISLFVFLGLSFLQNLFLILIQILQAFFNKNFRITLQKIIYNNLLNFKIAYYEERQAGEIIQISTQELTRLCGGLWYFIQMLSALFICIILICILMMISTKLFFIFSLSLLLVMLLNRSMVKKIERFGAMATKVNLNISDIISETIQGIRNIKVLNLNEYQSSKYNNHAIKYANNVLTVLVYQSLLTPLTIILILFFGGLLVYLYFTDLLGLTMPLSTFLLFLIIMNRLSTQIQAFNRNLSLVAERIFSVYKIIEYLFPQKSNFENSGNYLSKGSLFNDKIIFNIKSFNYPTKTNILNKIDFDIKRGETVALVGESGAGKTTIARLLTGFYEITNGVILFDDIPFFNMDLPSLRSHIGIVMQSGFLFNTSIKENISLGNLYASFEQIVTAAKRAYIHDFIITLENGYDTIVGDKGLRLSGGQIQRIMIAQVFLKDPDVIIFDEATSSLDSKSETYIQKSITNFSKNKTLIIIAHRLSTIKNADKIVVMNKGLIHELGSWDELIMRKGLLYDFCRSQEIIS